MSPASLRALPPVGRAYVAAVSASGGLAIAASVLQTDGSHSVIFAILLCLSLAASVAKINIPVPGGESSITVCHVIDYVALMVCGSSAAVLVAAWGGWTQCTFKSASKNPLHQVVFSVASLGLAMWAAGATYAWLGGQPGLSGHAPRFEPLAGAATVLFLLNSGLVAAAVALSTRRPVLLVWFNSFLAIWPSYAIGAGLAAGVAAVLERRAYWLIPLLAGPLLLLHRHFATYLDRLKEAVTDPLTKLPNQRFLMEHLARALEHARESHSPLAMVFFDLDDFKALNDRGGHAIGDKALCLVADRLRSAVRSRDVCARYAGDEFVAVFADCGRAEAELRAEELQSTIRKLAVRARSGSRMPLSVSAGIAVYPEDGDSIERLFVVADRRMYQRKSEDRNILRRGKLRLSS